MLKSKSIADFRQAKVSELQPGLPVPVDIYLYFQGNDHIILWQKKGNVLTAEQIAGYKARGLKALWIHESDWDDFAGYRRKSDEVPHDFSHHSRLNAQTFLQIIRDETKSEREKRALIAIASRDLLIDMTAPTSVEKQVPLNKVAAEIIQEFLGEITVQANPLANQIWAIWAIEPELNHAVNASTLAVLFSMAFGNIDEQLLSDIGLAALLHKVGVDLINDYAPEVPVRVRHLIKNQHENHSDVKTTDVGQLPKLLELADLVDSVSRGIWDGKKRTISESFITLDTRKKDLRADDLYSAEIFSALYRWICVHDPQIKAS